MKMDELKALRARAARQLHEDTEAPHRDEWRIVVSMDTTSILHGAREVLAAFLAEVAALKLENVSVSHAGGIGLHSIEPACWIRRHGGPKVVYGGLKPAMIRELLLSHVVNGTVLQAYEVVVPRVRARAHLAHHGHARHHTPRHVASLPTVVALENVFMKSA